MKVTLAIKLAPSRAQHAALVATLERFNAACSAIAAVAFREHLANKIALQKLRSRRRRHVSSRNPLALVMRGGH